MLIRGEGKGGLCSVKWREGERGKIGGGKLSEGGEKRSERMREAEQEEEGEGEKERKRENVIK
jgi:hypothetical protein